MSNDVHIFRCYADDPGDFIEVEATAEPIARAFAAENRGWEYERVIARYVRTLGSRAEHPLEKGLRDGWEKSKSEMAVK